MMLIGSHKTKNIDDIVFKRLRKTRIMLLFIQTSEAPSGSLPQYGIIRPALSFRTC